MYLRKIKVLFETNLIIDKIMENDNRKHLIVILHYYLKEN